MLDVMIDLETAGTEPGCSILTLAAYAFNRHAPPVPIPEAGKLPIKDLFYARVDLASCEKAGLVMEPETVLWWMQQDFAARHEAFHSSPRVPIRDVLDALSWQLAKWTDGEAFSPWSHGLGFDITLLEHAYRLLGMPIPWDFRNCRDTRTLYEVSPTVRPDNPVPHHAAHDAIVQAHAVQQTFAQLRSDSDGV